MLKFYTLVLLCSLNIANAKIHFKDVQFKKLSPFRGQVEVLFSNDIVEIPRLKFEGNKIHLFMPQTKIPTKIVRKLSLKKGSDMVIKGEQFSSRDSLLSIFLPHPVKSIAKKVHVSLKGKKVLLDFPLKIKRNGKFKTIKKIGLKSKSKDDYDEIYLQKLIDEKNAKSNTKNNKSIKTDMVKKSFSSLPKEKKGETFSLGKQIAKFALFLVLVIAIFYGIVFLIKKSMMSKNKLGFLNSTKIVEVLNTTYIAPKRSMMLVRAHKQIFLIGNSEKGFHSLGELTDIAGLLKEGEKAISGNNFDTSLQSASSEDKEFSLKETMKIQNVKEPEEDTRLSEKIKNKVKELRALQ